MFFAFVSVSVLFLISVVLDDILLGLGSCAAALRERVAHSVDHLLFLCCECLLF